MKTIVSVQELLELEIKPGDLLAEFYAQTAVAVPQFLHTDLRLVPCPGCGTMENPTAFEKLGLTYRHCRQCATLYISPRPLEAALTNYYRNSTAALFWREHILPATDEARLEKIIQPRMQWVLDGLDEGASAAKVGLDVSAHGRALVEELRRAGIERMIAAHPTADLDFATPLEGVTITPRPLTDWAALGPVDFITAFDVLDRCADVHAFVENAYNALRPGGTLFITAPASSGFDVQVLWERARLLTPPDKLNVLSIEGFTTLFAAPRWQIAELSTPGMLDVESVRRAIQAEPNGAWPRFIRYLVEQRDEGARLAFQEYLQMYRLSSFARLVVRKVG